MGKRLLVVLIMLALLGSAGAQVSSHTAFRIRFGAALPATCSPNTGDVFFKTAATIGAYQCLVANTWTVIGGTSLPALSDNGTRVTSTEPLIITVAGSSANAAISFAALTEGIMYASSATWGLQVDATNWLQLSNSGSVGPLAINASGYLSWSSSNTFNAAVGDAFLRRRTTANIALGVADVNGVPVAQTLSVQNAITGSNLPGTAFTVAGPLGTGTGLPAPIIIQGADQSVATGTTSQTEIPRFVIGDTKNLTTGAATTVLSIPLATLQMAGGHIIFHMEATDGTNQCTRDGAMSYSAENSAGVFVTNVTDATGTLDSTACTAAKTLTLTWAVTSANPALVQVTPTLTGITATRFSLNYTVYHGGNTAPTL